MELSSYTRYELEQLAYAEDRRLAKMAGRVLAANSRDVLLANGELADPLLCASSNEAYQAAVRADLGMA